MRGSEGSAKPGLPIRGGGGDVTKKPPDDVSIGKFDILATYTNPSPRLGGGAGGGAKRGGRGGGIRGARARLGIRKTREDDFQAKKKAAERKKRTTIPAESFDRQVRDKLGHFFDD